MSVPLSLLRALIGRPTHARKDVLATLRQPLRAWPWLCDQLGHINNARYVDLLGYGRLHWLLETGLFGPVLKQRMSFVIAGVGGVYRRPIPRMGHFVLESRLAAYDARWLYHEQTFRLGVRGEGLVAARFISRGQILLRGEGLAPREALERCKLRMPEQMPIAPPDLEAWVGAQDACLDQMRGSSSYPGVSGST
jgi:acyl-CoA thioesterase FadM